MLFEINLITVYGKFHTLFKTIRKSGNIYEKKAVYP